MKKLGLIGGTGPESTIIYYKKITSQVQQLTGNFPNLTIESLSVYDVLRFMDNSDYDGLMQYLLNGINTLANANVDMVALTGITPHIVIDRLKAKSPVPVVSMLDTTKDYLKDHNLKNVLLTGTAQTIKAGFFQKYLKDNGFNVIIPNEQQVEYMGEKIESELELGKVIPETKERFTKIVDEIVKNNSIDALVLGCTELPLIFDQIDLSIPKVDVMNEHINKLVSLIVEK